MVIVWLIKLFWFVFWSVEFFRFVFFLFILMIIGCGLDEYCLFVLDLEVVFFFMFERIVFDEEVINGLVSWVDKFRDWIVWEILKVLILVFCFLNIFVFVLGEIFIFFNVILMVLFIMDLVMCLFCYLCKL